jgi:hypothetical protein
MFFYGKNMDKEILSCIRFPKYCEGMKSDRVEN